MGKNKHHEWQQISSYWKVQCLPASPFEMFVYYKYIYVLNFLFIKFTQDMNADHFLTEWQCDTAKHDFLASETIQGYIEA